jgi:hypothetical protein
MEIAYVLFTKSGKPETPEKIRKIKDDFGGKGYQNTINYVIFHSSKLDISGKVFVECTSKVLTNFKMTRAGRFKGEKNRKKLLKLCWTEIGSDLLKIRTSINKSGLSRDRFLLELEQTKREALISEIWRITKKLLPITMSEASYGLVAASKILFAVLPEIVLPVDNTQWRSLFKTVDLGDVTRMMVSDIQNWEKATGKKLNEMESNKFLTTLPSVYNSVAMKARSKKYLHKGTKRTKK